MSSERASFRPRKVRDVEPGKSFVMHSAELIGSAAWRTRSIHVARLLDRLEVEHCAHAGRENGYLTVTYDQLVEWGIGRRFIKGAIEDAAESGLIEVYAGLYRGGARRQPSRYRLTYLKSKFVPVAGAPYFVEPTNEWRAFRSAAKARK